MEKSLYIHIPFCISKCKYCDFNSQPIGELEEAARNRKMEGYLEALISEIRIYGKRLRTDEGLAKLETIFFGGGTPSLLNGSEFKDIMDSIGEEFVLAEGCEVTMEMNPETVKEENIREYVKSGLNRVSMGAQTFDDGVLKSIGRIHNSEKIHNAYKIIKDSGIGNISLDIMTGLSGQNLKTVENDLINIGILKPEHISVYMLQLEEGTEYESLERMGKLNVPDEEDTLLMFNMISEFLKDKGYIRYEISNFSKPGFESRHNRVYWKNKEYIGVGMGAHGYLNGVRYENTDNLTDYILRVNSNGKLTINEIFVDEEEKIFNEVMLGLRLIEGIDLDDFYNMYGIDFERFYKRGIVTLVREGLGELISEKDKRVFRLTETGLEIQNYCLGELLL